MEEIIKVIIDYLKTIPYNSEIYVPDIIDLFIPNMEETELGKFALKLRAAAAENGIYFRPNEDCHEELETYYTMDLILKNRNDCPRCTKCKSRYIAENIYGMITFDAFESYNFKHHKVRWKGCIENFNSKKYHCNKCGHEFGSYKEHDLDINEIFETNDETMKKSMYEEFKRNGIPVPEEED